MAPLTQPVATVGRRGRLRRRFIVVSAGALSVLMAILGVSFAADSGTVNVSVSDPSDGVVVRPVGVPGAATGVTLTYGSTFVTDAWTVENLPNWAVAAGTAGSVPASAGTDPDHEGAGDLAYIDADDATSTTMMVSLFVTNLDKLAAAYSSYNFKIALYSSTDGATGWGSPVETAVLTSDSGTINWIVDIDPARPHFTVTIEEGGSYYTVSTSEPANLTPSFFIRASQL